MILETFLFIIKPLVQKFLVCFRFVVNNVLSVLLRFKEIKASIKKNLVILISAFFSASLPVSADSNSPIFSNNILFENYNIKHGLSQVSINEVIEDRHGFIWVSTQSGLNRFDGYSFLTYKNTNQPKSLPSNYLTDLLFDSNNMLWIGTQLTGVAIYDENTGLFSNFQHDKGDITSLSSNFINVLMQDANGRLWVGSKGGLDLWQPNTKSFVRYNDIHPLLERLNIQDVAQTSDGLLWIASSEGLYLFDTENNRFLNTNFVAQLTNIDNSERANNVLSLHVTQGKKVWLGTGSGIFLIELNHKKYQQGQLEVSVDNRFNLFAHSTNDLNMLTINDLLTDSDSVLWLATQAHGLCKLSPNSRDINCQRADTSNPMALQSNSLSRLYIDRYDQLWVGTSASGLSKYIEISSNFLTVRDIAGQANKLNGKIIFAIHEKDNFAWIGSLTKGITEFNLASGEAKYYQNIEGTEQSILENGVVGLYKQGDYLWIGYRNVTGLTRLNLITQEYRHYQFYNQSDIPLRVRQILPIRSGHLLLSGPDSGLILFNPDDGSYVSYRNNGNNEHGLITNDIITMDEGYGYIWLASNKGLLKFDQQLQRFHHIPIPVKDNSEIANYLFSVRVGKNQDVWLGSQQGLHHYDIQNGQFKTFRMEDGLPNEEIDTILIDHVGDLWLATNNGLSYFNTKDIYFESYFEDDGIQHNEHAVGAGYTGESGRFYFGGVNGFTIFNPRNFKRIKRTLTPSITSIYITNKEVALNSPLGLELLPAPIHTLDQLTLSYKHANLFSFAFSALDYHAPGKVEYEYRMKGVLDNWVSIDTKQRQVNFTGLSSGHYQLQLRARYQGNAWPESIHQLDLNITPPLWQTWWAYTIYSLLVAFYILSIFRRQKQKIREKEAINKKLEIMVSERTHELEEKNIEVLKMVEKEKESKHEIAVNLETITEQHHQLEDMMEKLKETQEELVQKEKMASLGALVAGIAHEVNTPIGICVTGITHLKHHYEELKAKVEDETATDDDLEAFFEDLEECCHMIISNTGKAADLIQSFKRIAVDQSSEDVRELQIRQYLDEIIISMKPMLKRLPHTISISCPNDIMMNTVAGALSQIITNLIQNSVLHAFKDDVAGEITISVVEESNHYHIYYEDNGAGMDENQVNNYFEPFFTTKRNQGGSGLGGHLIFNLVTGKLNGKITLKSQLNQGIQVDITLPK